MTPPPDLHPDYESWPPDRGQTPPPWAAAPWGVVIFRGLRGICPNCGQGKIFDGYLKVHRLCSVCSAPLGDMPADDAPPYVAMLVILHVMAIFILLFYKGVFLPSPLLMAFMLLMLTAICMAALRLAKGAIIGILLKLGFKREVLNG